MSDPLLLFPRDWHVMDTDCLGVVFRGEIPEDCQFICLLWPQEDYRDKPDWRDRKVLATAQSHKQKNGLHAFFFRDLKYYGACTISVRIFSDPPRYHDIGVWLSPSRVTTVRLHDKRLTTRVCENIRFPLVEVWTEHSNYQHTPSHYDGTVELLSFDRIADQFRAAPEAPGTIRMAICHPAETRDANGTLLTEYCDGLELLPRDPSSWTASETYYALLPQVTACLRIGHTLFEDRYRWGDACPSPDYVDPQTTSMYGAFQVDGQRGIVDTRRWEFCGTDAVPMLVANAGRNNYGHWLQNSMMAMFFVRDAINAGKILPVTPPLTDRQLRPLELIGITRDRILETNEATVYFPKVIYPSFISTHTTSFPGKWWSDCFNVIREGITCNFAETPPDYIYFTRSGFSAGHKRGIENEPELIDMLRGIGFHIIAPHENTFDENLYLISRAKIIISTLGAAMADIVFAPKGCVVIELICDCYFHNVHLYLAHLMEQKLIRLVSKPVPESVGSPEGFRFHVSIDHLKRAALAAMAS